MLVEYGNVWDIARDWYADAIAITTNGYVKRDGRAVMGRGIARQALNRFPGIDAVLGAHIKAVGNNVFAFPRTTYGFYLVSFPVKPKYTIADVYKTNVVSHMRGRFSALDRVPGWAAVAEIKIINDSALQLVDLADEMEWEFVVVPRPGCGAGELDWSDVEPVLSNIFDDRFHVVTYA